MFIIYYYYVFVPVRYVDNENAVDNAKNQFQLLDASPAESKETLESMTTASTKNLLLTDTLKINRYSTCDSSEMPFTTFASDGYDFDVSSSNIGRNRIHYYKCDSSEMPYTMAIPIQRRLISKIRGSKDIELIQYKCDSSEMPFTIAEQKESQVISNNVESKEKMFHIEENTDMNHNCNSSKMPFPTTNYMSSLEISTGGEVSKNNENVSKSEKKQQTSNKKNRSRQYGSKDDSSMPFTRKSIEMLEEVLIRANALFIDDQP